MKIVPVNRPLIKGNELKYVSRVIKSGWISADGDYVKKFERKFSKYIKRKFSVAVSSGTAALDIAFQSINLKVGDEVIVPTFTIISCLNQIVRMGAKPVLVDADCKTFNIDINQLKKKITKKTKAILIVHIYGLPVDVDAVLDVAKKKNIYIIEDAAEQLGQTYKGKPLGSFGDISIFSFFANKHITTGEGGMIATNSKKLLKKFLVLRNLSFQIKKQKFIHEELGWNYRMTSMQAAFGLAQLEKIKDFIKKKRNIGNFYNRKFKFLKNIVLPLKKNDFAENIYWVYSILLKNKNAKAKYYIRLLKKNGIEARPFFCPMHLQPVFKKMKLFKKIEKFPVSEMLFEKGFYIPSGLGTTNKELNLTAKKLLKIFNNKIK